MRLIEGRAVVDDLDAFLRELSEIGEDHDAVVQAFDARYVAGRAHLEAAARSARRAIEHGDAIADDPAVELLLYAAGRRQIDRALTIGVVPGEGPVVVAVYGGDEDGAAAAVARRLEPAETLGEARDEELLREFYGVTAAELGATDAGLEELVVERVALLAVEK